MATPADLSSIPKESIYQNIQNTQLAKLTLCERVSRIFFRIYEKISNLFSRKPSQMKKLEGVEPIYDVPKNNRPVKTLTLYERVSNFFAKGPSQVKLLEEKFNEEITQLQKTHQKLERCICVNVRKIKDLEAQFQALTDETHSQKAQVHTLEETISAPKDSSSSPSLSRSDSGCFPESPPMKKKHNSFLSKASQLLKSK